MEHSITNLRAIYWDNQNYRYPLPWVHKQKGTGDDVTTGAFLPAISTGWHILPNFLWGHVASPRQWWEMVQQFEAISVVGVSAKIFNPIPIQTALSFQGTNTFPAFNNTVYSLTYTDDLYETPWFDWHADVYAQTSQLNMFYEWNPAFKEGVIPNKVAQPFDYANDIPESREQLEKREDLYPRHYYTQITQNVPPSVYTSKLTYRRQFLPIYWYSFPFPQYVKTPGVGSWDATGSWWENSWYDPSGIFWDPLNRPDALGELRPGKNMVQFSWEAHPSDHGIWFNTDRIALLTPYPRPRPLQPYRATINMVDKPQPCDPITPGPPANAYEFLKRYGLCNEDADLTVPLQAMAPETSMGLPNWRDFPIVPTRWFLKEIQESNPFAYDNIHKCYYRKPTANCPNIGGGGSLGPNLTKGDVDITGPMENTKFPGTEYEMYKYPPTQWFIKGIPLFDDQDKLIPVQFQAFMLTTVKILGKPRKSALYAPSWGPILPQDLYSVNMDTSFGENFVRGRSGGARRTWMNPEAPRAVRNVPYEQVYLYQGDTDTSPQQTKVPSHPHQQCINEPAAQTYKKEEWPRRSVLASQDTKSISVTVHSDRYKMDMS